MNQSSSLSAHTQDEIRVCAWAEVRDLLELQLIPLGREALRALALNPNENVLDIGCGGGDTAGGPPPGGAPPGRGLGLLLLWGGGGVAERAAPGGGAGD